MLAKFQLFRKPGKLLVCLLSSQLYPDFNIISDIFIPVSVVCYNVAIIHHRFCISLLLLYRIYCCYIAQTYTDKE